MSHPTGQAVRLLDAYRSVHDEGPERAPSNHESPNR